MTQPLEVQKPALPDLDEWKRIFSSAPITSTVPEQDDFSILGEIGRTIGTGAHKFVQSFGELPADLGITEKPLYQIPNVIPEPQTTIGKFGAVAVQFLIPYSVALRGISLVGKLAKIGKLVTPTTKVGKFAKYTTAGAVADVIYTPTDPNLSTFLQSLPTTQKIPIINEITNLLATDEDDSNALNRFRNVVEGMGLGVAVPIILKGLGLGVKATGQLTAGAIKALPGGQSGIDVLRSVGTQLRFQIDKRVQKLADKALAPQLVQEAVSRQRIKLGQPTENITDLSISQEFRMLEDIGVKVDMFFNDGTYIFKNNVWTRTGEPLVKITEDVEKLGSTAIVDMQDLLMYTRAKQLLNTPHASPIPKSDIITNLDRLQALPHYQGLYLAMHRYIEFNSRYLDFIEAMGDISKATRKRLEYMADGITKYVWAPFYRSTETELFKNPYALTEVKYTSQDVIRKRRKSFNKLPNESQLQYEARLRKALEDDPIGGMFYNMTVGYSSGIEHALKNSAKRSIYDAVTELGEDGIIFAEKISKKVKSQIISKDNIKNIFTKHNIGTPTAFDDLQEEMFPFFSNRVDMEKNTDVIFRNGEAEYWKINDTLLLDSLQSIGPNQMLEGFRNWSRIGSGFKNLLTRLVTMNPKFFLISNLLRDTVAVSLLSRGGFVPFYSTLRGLMHTLTNSKTAKDFVIQGGSFGAGRTYGEARHIANYTKQLKTYGFDPSNKNVFVLHGQTIPKRLLNKLDSITQKFEFASRTAEYERLLKLGYSPVKAAFYAREVAVDFANRGSSAHFKAYTNTVPFLNASIQGINRMLRAMGTKKLFGRTLSSEEAKEATKLWALLFHYSWLAGALVPLMQYSSKEPGVAETYKKIPDYLKSTATVIVLPKDEQTGEHGIITFPKPFEFGILSTLIEKLLETQYTEHEKGLLYDYLTSAGMQLISRGGMSNLPQVLRAPAEIAFNKKFTKAPIVPGGLEEGTIAQRRYWTRPSAIWIADTFGKLPGVTDSPLVAEHFLNSFFGGLGLFVLDAIDEKLARPALGLSAKPVENDDKWWQKGFVNAVYKHTPLRFTRNEEKLYDAAIKARDFQADFNSVKKQFDEFDTKKFNEFMTDPESLFWIEHYPMFTNVLKRIGAINSSIDFLAKSNPADLYARNELLKTKQELIDIVMDVFFKDYKQYQREQKNMAAGGEVVKNPNENKQLLGETYPPLKLDWRDPFLADPGKLKRETTPSQEGWLKDWEQLEKYRRKESEPKVHILERLGLANQETLEALGIKKSIFNPPPNTFFDPMNRYKRRRNLFNQRGEKGLEEVLEADALTDLAYTIQTHPKISSLVEKLLNIGEVISQTTNENDYNKYRGIQDTVMQELLDLTPEKYRDSLATVINNANLNGDRI